MLFQSKNNGAENYVFWSIFLHPSFDLLLRLNNQDP